MLKRCASLFLALLLIFALFPVSSFATGFSSEAKEENGFWYEVEGGEATLLGSAAEGKLVIPEELGGYPVTNIGSSAYYCNYDITELYVPDTCKRISGDAFLNCTSLSKIRLPEYIELSWQVFTNTAFYNNKDNWENGLLYLDKHLLHAKKSLEGKVAIKPGTLTIARCCFEQCGKITEVEFPDSLLFLGEMNFLNCNSLEKLELPPRIKRLGMHTFTGCLFEEIYIHENIEYLDSEAFADCANVISIKVSPDNKIYESENNCVIRKEDSLLLLGCKQSVIPEGISAVGPRAFSGTASPEEVVIPDSAKSIGDYAFFECDTLEKITLSKNLDTIGRYAFACCDGFDCVSFPETIKKFENSAFWKCTRLKNIEFPRNVGELYFGLHSFSECTALEEIFIPRFSEFASPFVGCTSLKKLEFFGESTFFSSEFSDSPLEEIVIAEGSKVIKWNNIPNAENIKKITLPSSLEVIEAFAFENCVQLEEITLPAALKEIGVSPFYNCPKLAKIELLSDSVDVAYSDSLNGTAYIENEENWEDGVLYLGNILIKAKDEISGTLNIKEGTRLLSFGALNSKFFLTGLTFPKSLEIISDEAVRGCSALIEVDVPSSIKKIGENAFNETNNTRYTCYAGSAGFDYFMKAYNIYNDNITYVCDHKQKELLCYQAPTCTMEGNTGFYRCNICFKDLTEAKNTPPTGKHIKKANKILKATPKKNGYISYSCQSCPFFSENKTIYSPKTIKLSASKYEYSGKQRKPTVKVYDSKAKLIEASNYDIKYASGRKSIGKYKVTVKFKGSKYSGEISAYFEITPPKTSIKSTKALSRGFKVSWAKKSKNVSGYEISYSTSSKFSSAKKVSLSYKTSSKTIKSLKSKKKYYIRVRSYKTVSGKKIYSAYSSVKSIKTK